MKFIPEQNFIQHVSTQKYEFSMLDWFGGVLHPTFINFRWFRTFVRSNCNSNFLMCFRTLNFVSITNIYCEWERHKTMYYSCITRPCVINKVSNSISIANLQLLRSWNKSLKLCLTVLAEVDGLCPLLGQKSTEKIWKINMDSKK